MLVIDGAIRLVPLQIAADTGTFKLEEDQPETAAVIQTIITANGPVQVIYPVDVVDDLIRVLSEAKQEAGKGVKPNTDLYIPNSMSEADALAARENAIRNADK